ncbi:MAG: polysaccharide pyruvyl transferase CsaB [Oceanicoccus sp.]|jgi:polysaccharide pyruvyl transferase CsaB
MGPKRILIVGNYGAGNLGDDAILGGIVTELRSVGYQGELMVTHGAIATSSRIYKDLRKVPFVPTGIRSRFKRKQVKAARRAIQKADLVILGGGGLFVDRESWKAPLIWSQQARWCRKLGTPYICYGQSVGPLKHWLSRHLAKKTFRYAKAIHVRDEASLIQLQEWDLLHAQQGTDPSLSYLSQLQPETNKNNQILISIREWGSFKAKDWEALLLPIQDFAQKHELHPIILSMDPGNPQEQLELKNIGFKLFVPTSVDQAFEGLSAARMAVSMRLHANIFALLAGTSLVTLSYSQKVKSFFKSLKVSKAQVLEQKDWNEAAITEALEFALAQKPQFNLEEAMMNNQAFLAHYLEL